MYWRYAFKRVLMGVMIYFVIIFVYAVLFNVMFKLHYSYLLEGPILPEIFSDWFDTITFNYGQSMYIRSFKGETDVIKIILERVPNTMLLFTMAIIIDIFLGVYLGIKKAQKAGGFMDKTTSILTMIFYGLPTWWVGLVMIMFFSFKMPLFPSGGIFSIPPPVGFIKRFADIVYHLILPLTTLVFFRFWGRAYLSRNIVLANLQNDFIISARARGIPERKVLFGHALRASAPPILTMSVLSVLDSFSGALIIEGIFNWPGMGNLFWAAIQQDDIPVLLGNLSFTTLLYICGIVILDLIYGFLDPRIKVGGKE
jgi:peptide/nickel transport system permease protein